MQFKTAHISEYVLCFQWHRKTNPWIYQKKKKEGKEKNYKCLRQRWVQGSWLSLKDVCTWPRKGVSGRTGKGFPRQADFPSQPGPFSYQNTSLTSLSFSFSCWILFSSLGEIFCFFLCSLGHFKGERYFGTLHSFYFKLILTGFQVIFVIGSLLPCSKD